MLSLDLSSLVSLFELSFSYLQDVLIWCARFLPYLYLPYHYHYLLIRVAYYLEHSPPFHLALPAIVIHRLQCILRYLHLVPSPLQMISSSDLYRHYRDTISTRPSTRWDWHLTSGASTGLWLYMAVRDEPAALPFVPTLVIGLWQHMSLGRTPLKVIDMVDQPSPGVSVISC